eukprot:TRINITY_DN66154_c0_g1_i1.p1 TRINITY_DN66154_c0_g1~~TRINITY_DN66154_c0_g1_i1.p1  ORF type:complete len:209 (+),score=45.14 TRINITY_DN66154_c0_g1_i1:90-716(+)
MDPLSLLSDDEGDLSADENCDQSEEFVQSKRARVDSSKKGKLGFEALKLAGYDAGSEQDEQAAAAQSLSQSFSALEQTQLKQVQPPENGTSILGCDTTFEILKTGSQEGKPVSKGCRVSVHATGIIKKTGKIFWSTRDPGQQPHSYDAGAGKVIPGWDKGCMGMRKGETRRLIIPGHEAYGSVGFAAWGIPPHATLDFTLECLDIFQA